MTTAYVTGEDQIVAYDPGEHTLEDNFRRFHAENPHVYGTLVRLAQDWRAKHPGRHCGIGMLYEVARWELDLRGEGEPVALNNNYRAFFARMMMDREPELAGLFEIRRQRGLNDGANGGDRSAVVCPIVEPVGSTGGGADAGLAAVPAARTAGPSAPSHRGVQEIPAISRRDAGSRSKRRVPSTSASPEDAAAGTLPEHPRPAAAPQPALFDLPKKAAWA